ncbi:MAG: glycine cleavage system aminomethyltransferase GcvT [Acidobacteriota bacterium]|nr:glycine cleavage system aminomethyltransferase GcvT [Blastocatellia bacterium]MDW8239606.1 glycine cleavage system aminomethyltransferase GcvT [Acidobacteriota bacterium]
MAKQTPLYEAHKALGGKMIEFAGWSLPVQYSGAIEEHMATREAAGLFDVSHMGRLEVVGPDAIKVVQRLTTNDADRLADGQIQYSVMTTPQGTVMDDLTVYRFNRHFFLLVVNAVNLEKIYRWICQHLVGVEASLYDVSRRYAQIAIQGPAAEDILQSLTDIELDHIRYYWFDVGEVAGIPRTIISRTGYTGEDGFELYIPMDKETNAEWVWGRLLERGRHEGLKPCGLASRNTLRLEAKMLLYGNDMDETTTVLEAGLDWITKFEKGDFIGREALLRQKEAGLKRRLVGFEVLDRAPAREHYPVWIDDQMVGHVTSGSPAPFLKKNIGLAYLPIEYTGVGTRFHVQIRDRRVEAQVVPTPFYKRKK